jgi:ribosomal protein S18 acetylase RimI-like enzyme
MLESEPWKTLQFKSDTCLQAVSHPHRESHIARSQGHFCGFVVINLLGPFAGYIQLLGVAPAYRSQGVGAALLDCAKRRIFAEQPNVFLCVSAFNTGAIRFYLQRGYSQAGEIENYVVQGQSEWLMRKTHGPLNGYIGCQAH